MCAFPIGFWYKFAKRFIYFNWSKQKLIFTKQILIVYYNIQKSFWKLSFIYLGIESSFFVFTIT